MRTRVTRITFLCLALVASLATAHNLYALAADTPSSGGSQLWKILNSSFALWFLSSVVLAAITGLYTRHQKSQSERVEKTKTLKRLNTEISSRIANSLLVLRLDKKRVDAGRLPYPASGIYSEAVAYLDNNRRDDKDNLLDFSIYPENKSRRFRSLLYELTVVAEPGMLAAMREADASYIKLEALADETPLQEDSSKPLDREQQLAAIAESCQLLEQLQRHHFWRARL